MNFVTLIVQILVPLDIAFDILQNFREGVGIAITTTFFVDFILNFRVIKLNSEGEEITDAVEIVANYLKSWQFYIDVISAIPILVISNNYRAFRSLRVMTLMLLLKALKLNDEIHLSGSTEVQKLQLKLVKLIVFLLIYIHVTTCLLFMIVDIEQTWLPSQTNFALKGLGFYEQSVTTKYLVTQYTAVMTLTGSDIYPDSELMVFFSCGMTVSGALLIANLFGTITFVVQALNRK